MQTQIQSLYSASRFEYWEKATKSVWSSTRECIVSVQSIQSVHCIAYKFEHLKSQIVKTENVKHTTQNIRKFEV